MDFLAKLLSAFAISTVVAFFASFLFVLFLLAYINLLRLNYYEQGAYWGLSYGLIFFVATWLLSFSYFIRY